MKKACQVTVRIDEWTHQRLQEYVRMARDKLSMADLCRAGIANVLDRLDERPLERHIERYIQDVSGEVPCAIDGITPRQFLILLEELRKSGPGGQMDLTIAWNADDTLHVDVHEMHDVEE